MPIISRFLGIIIAMYWDDHTPPHFHAKYGEYEVIVNILNGVVEGKFPKRALRHVLEWYEPCLSGWHIQLELPVFHPDDRQWCEISLSAD